MKGDSDNFLKILMDTFTDGEFELAKDKQEEYTDPLICHRYEDGRIVVRTQEFNNISLDRW